MNHMPMKKILLFSLCIGGSSLLYAADSTPISAQDDYKQMNQVDEEVKKADEKQLVRKKRKRRVKKSLAPSALDSQAELTIRGSAAFNAFIGNQKNKDVLNSKSGPTAAGGVSGDPFSQTEARRASKHFALQDSKLEFQVLRMIDPLKNLSWRFNIAFSADQSASSIRKFVKQAYITLMSNLATIHLGNYAGVDDSMAFSGGSVLGDIGLDGFSNITSFVPVTSGTYTSLDLIGSPNEATKITVLSARYKGFGLGFSYTPSTSQFGNASLNTSSAPTWGGAPSPYTVNNFGLGLNYIGFILPDLKASLSVTSVLAQARPERTDFAPGQSLQRQSVRSLAFGGVLNYRSFMLGAEYAFAGRSMQFSTDRAAVAPTIGTTALTPLNYVAKNASAPQWWNIGLSYIYRQTKFAAGYMSSWRKTGFSDIKARARIYNLSVTYQKMPGLDIYVEGFKVNTKNDAAVYEAQLNKQSLPSGVALPSFVTNQKANVLVLGMKVSF